MLNMKQEFLNVDLLKVGDVFETYFQGRGRGGHVVMKLEVTKINAKSIKATEAPGSYCAGCLWTLGKSLYKDILDENGYFVDLPRNKMWTWVDK